MKHELYALEAASVFLGDKRAFSDFHLHIYEGEILGIICDSVAEEQALHALFRGECRIEGTMRIGRKSVRQNALKAASDRTFFLIDERLSLISTLSVSENICIFSQKSVFVRSQSYRNVSRELLSRFGLAIDTDRPVQELTTQEKILVMPLQAYLAQRRIIILSGISETVTEGEFAPVYGLIRRMADMGFAFVIMDSIETNIFSGADQVMVIRGGSDIACFEAAFFNRESFWSYMFRRQSSPAVSEALFDSFTEDEEEELFPAISLEHVSTAWLKDVTFSAGSGELLKILCLDSRTVRGLSPLVSGETPVLQGSFLVNGRSFRRPQGYGAAMRRGVIWCPESPYRSAVVETMSLRDNLMLPLAGKVRALFMQRGYTEHIDRLLRTQFGIETPQKKAAECSPETLQKVVYARILISAPSVLFIEKPFVETDVRIRKITLDMIRILLNRGVSIILLTSAPSTLSLIDGDEIYAKNGRIISEEEMYRSFYSEG